MDALTEHQWRQRQYLRWLARLSPEKKSPCGWYLKGGCPTCNAREEEQARQTLAE